MLYPYAYPYAVTYTHRTQIDVLFWDTLLWYSLRIRYYLLPSDKTRSGVGTKVV